MTAGTPLSRPPRGTVKGDDAQGATPVGDVARTPVPVLRRLRA